MVMLQATRDTRMKTITESIRQINLVMVAVSAVEVIRLINLTIHSESVRELTSAILIPVINF
jgi:hypothetical protein